MNDQQTPADPPRRPLRVPRAGRLVGGRDPDDEGGLWRILRPDDPAYDHEYQLALGAYHAYGTALPYADLEQDGGGTAEGDHGC